MDGIRTFQTPGSYAWKPRFQILLRPWVRSMATRGVTANMLTIAATVLSVTTGIGLTFFGRHTEWFLLLPLVLFARMALNAADGMLAREHGQRSTGGFYLNELGDQISDVFLLLPFSIVPGVNGFWLAVAAWLMGLSETAGVLATSAGGQRNCEGPLGKSDRAILLGAVAACIGFAGGLPLTLAALFAPGLALLLSITIVQRTRHGIFACREVQNEAL